MEEKGRVVAGFLFLDEKEAEQAKREEEGIAYITQRTDMKDPQVVLLLYQKMIQEKLFVTPVGMTFLKQTRDYLLSSAISERELPAIDAGAAGKAASDGAETEHAAVDEETLQAYRRQEKRKRQEIERRSKKSIALVRKNLRLSLLCNLFLLILVVGIVAVSLSSNHVTILNYRSRLENEYARWEQELSQREQAVRQKEQELGIQ